MNIKMNLTQKALPCDEADDILDQVKSPQSPITPEDSAWYPDQLVATKIQDSQLAQSRKRLHL